jgi:hypothetical protein
MYMRFSSPRPPLYPVRKLGSCSCAAVAPNPSESPSTLGVGGGIHSYKSGAYLLWPGNDQLLASADERAACFSGLQKAGGVMNNDGEAPRGNQASTLLELMTIRAYHSLELPWDLGHGEASSHPFLQSLSLWPVRSILNGFTKCKFCHLLCRYAHTHLYPFNPV